MKRIIALFLCLLFCVSIIACDKDIPKNDDSSDSVTDTVAETKAVDLKLLSNNIRIDNSGSSAALLKEAYAAVDADVLALQEVDDDWYNALKLESLLSDIGYTMVPVPDEFKSDIYGPDDAESNRNPIFYKADKFELVEHGRKLYDAFSFPGATKNGSPLYGYRSYSYTWALLKEKSTGLQLVVISTHLNAGVQHAEATKEEIGKAGEYRLKSASELVKAIKNFETKYNCPVVSVGDYNSNLESDPYGLLTRQYNSARKKATTTVNMEYNTSCNFGQAPKEEKGAIDHCIYSKKGITGNHFETLLKAGRVNTYSYSDHVPIYFEFTLHN